MLSPCWIQPQCKLHRWRNVIVSTRSVLYKYAYWLIYHLKSLLYAQFYQKRGVVFHKSEDLNVTSILRSVTRQWLLYTMSGKKRTNSILGITSSNTSRFSKFFQCRNLLKICNNTAIKFPTIPQTRRYTTLWKTDVRKLVNQRDASHHFVAQNKNLGITNTFKQSN